jgi:hypothetical protein
MTSRASVPTIVKPRMRSHQHLHEAPLLARCVSSEDGTHRHLFDAHPDPLAASRLELRRTDMGEGRIGEHAVGDRAVARAALSHPGDWPWKSSKETGGSECPSFPQEFPHFKPSTHVRTYDMTSGWRTDQACRDLGSAGQEAAISQARMMGRRRRLQDAVSALPVVIVGPTLTITRDLAGI